MNDTAVETPISNSPVAAECETIYAPVIQGIDAELLLLPLADGWRAGARARLPEASYDCPPAASDLARESRESALVVACEELIAWCGEQKPLGGKRHRKEAEALQDWALAEERKVAEAASMWVPKLRIDIDAQVEPGHVELLAEARTSLAELQASAAPAQLPVEWIPIEDVYDSPWNPRQFYPEKEMSELVESMRAGGFRPWQPLVGRPIGEASEVWRTVAATSRRSVELAAGHRRSRAARLAGLTLVPVVVRPMSDEEFLRVLNFDNSGREDVHPLHEAAGWRVLMDRTGMGVNDIAAQIGQSKEYVYQRLKYTSLIDAACEAFLNREITPGHAILIARLEPKAQEKALKHALHEDWQGHRPSVRMLAQYLQAEEYVNLSGGAFDLSDRTLLAGAGACDDCAKRAKNIPGFELDSPEADVCTDRSCYTAKIDNHLVRVKKQLEDSGEPVVTISEGWSTRKKGVLAKVEYDVVELGAKGAKQALVVEGPSVGQVVTVKLKPQRQEATRPASQPNNKADSEKAEKERKAKVERELSIRRAILAAARTKVGGLTRADIEALLVVILEGGGYEYGDTLCDLHAIKYGLHGGERAMVSALPKLKESELYQIVVELSVVDELEEWAISRGEEPKALLALAKRYKVDAAKIRRGMEEAAKEAEGGTRREVVKEAPAAKKAATKKAGGLHAGAGKKNAGKAGEKKGKARK